MGLSPENPLPSTFPRDEDGDAADMAAKVQTVVDYCTVYQAAQDGYQPHDSGHFNNIDNSYVQGGQGE